MVREQIRCMDMRTGSGQSRTQKAEAWRKERVNQRRANNRKETANKC